MSLDVCISKEPYAPSRITTSQIEEMKLKNWEKKKKGKTVLHPGQNVTATQINVELMKL